MTTGLDRFHALSLARESLMTAMRIAGRLMPEDTPRGAKVAELFSALVQELAREEQGVPFR